MGELSYVLFRQTVKRVKICKAMKYLSARRASLQQPYSGFSSENRRRSASDAKSGPFPSLPLRSRVLVLALAAKQAAIVTRRGAHFCRALRSHRPRSPSPTRRRRRRTSSARSSTHPIISYFPSVVVRYDAQTKRAGG